MVINKEPEGAVVSVVALLGGSWVVVSKVICRVTIAITYVRGLMTRRKTNHEPPSKNRAHHPAQLVSAEEEFLHRDDTLSIVSKKKHRLSDKAPPPWHFHLNRTTSPRGTAYYRWWTLTLNP